MMSQSQVVRIGWRWAAFWLGMPVMARVAIWLWLACGTVSCSGSTASSPDGSSGAAGSGVAAGGSSSGGSSSGKAGGGAVRSFAVEPDASTLHVAGSFDAGAYAEARDAALGGLLRSAKAVSGVPDAYSVTVDSVGSLWLAGA